MDNYAKIAERNIQRLYENLPRDLAKNLPAEQDGDGFVFQAFGERCLIKPTGIEFGAEDHSSVFDILISLYALHACTEPCVDTPFKAFKEFPDSIPYVAAFMTHTEQVLIPHVDKIKESIQHIIDHLGGEKAPEGTGGDFAFVVYPLPKIGLCYIFYDADDDFSASVTCLYSNNARLFLPVDGLADVGEYCSKTLLKLIA